MEKQFSFGLAEQIALCLTFSIQQNMIKLLFIGDVVGKPGREIITKRLGKLREEMGLNLVVANGENSAGGAGISKSQVEELLNAGVDAVTLGDHVWDQRGFDAEINDTASVCRPANLPEQCPGKTHLVIEHEGFRLGVFTVLGRTLMKLASDCPFQAAERKLKELESETDGVLVEMHAETTSEKIAFGWFMDGRVSTVVGTHTHIPTADGRVLPRGTAYLTDAGMTGPYESILGREIEPIILKFLDGMPRRWPVAENDVRISGFYVELDKETGLADNCRHVMIYDEVAESDEGSTEKAQ